MNKSVTLAGFQTIASLVFVRLRLQRVPGVVRGGALRAQPLNTPICNTGGIQSCAQGELL